MTSETLQMTSVNLEIKIYLFIYWKSVFINMITLSDVKTCCSSLEVVVFESNLSEIIINNQTFFRKKTPNDLKEGPVFKAKGTTWSSKLKYTSGSVLAKLLKRLCSLVIQSYILPFSLPQNSFMKMMSVVHNAAYCVQISFSKLIVGGIDSPSFLRTLWS